MTPAPDASPDAARVEAPDAADRAAFGDFLRQARERHHLTLEQVASDTRISSRHLTALEQGNMASLPGGMYRRAMLRAYADSVGLDKDAALEQFERTFAPGAHASAPRTSAPAPSVRAVGPPVSAAAPPVSIAAAKAAAAREAGTEAAPAFERKSDIRVPLIGVVIAATAIVALVTGDRAADTQALPAAAASTVRVAAAASATKGADSDPAPLDGEARGSASVTTAAAPGVPAAVRTPAPNPAAFRADAAAPAAARPATASASPATTRPVPARRNGGEDTVRATSGDEDADRRTAARRTAAGEVAIVTEPAGARVTIDGTGWGTTPVTVRHLPFGAKRVRVTRDGYLSQERTVSVSPGRPAARLRLTLKPRE